MRKLLVALTIAASAALLTLLLDLTGFPATVEMKTYDARVRATARRNPARRDVVVVTIDEDSIRKLEPQVGRFPWPRLVHAQLVNYLMRAPAKVIAYDVLFSERDRTTFTIQGEQWTGQESDQAFVDAVAKAGNVVIGADATREEAESTEGAPSSDNVRASTQMFASGFRLGDVVEKRPVITPPFDDLARAARMLGHTFLALDADGPARRSVPFISVGDRVIPSLAVATAMVAEGMSPADVRLDRGELVFRDARMPTLVSQARTTDGSVRAARRALVRFTGPAGGAATANGDAYQEYSFYRLFYSELQIEAGETPLVDPAVFRNKLVLVGVTAAGLHDVFAVPLAGGQMPGTALHANVADNILSGRFMRPSPPLVAALLIAIAVLVVGMLGAFTSGWWTIAGGAAVVASLGAGGVALFAGGVWVPLVSPALATALAVSGGVAYQYFVEGREKRRIKRVFSRLVAPDVYAHLLAHPSRARLGGERRQMSVLFSDIRGFTTLTEGSRPEDIVAQLNEYFTRIVGVLFEYKGTVDKFVGDMVMALFSAPLDDPDDADHAVQAALGMLRALAELNEEWDRRGRPRIAIGIGINSGEMIAGTMGSEQVMSYTVIGDAVNLGSRLESLNKQYGTSIIISESTRQRLRGHYDIRPLGDVTVKGKTQPVAIFEVKAGGDNATQGGGR